VAQPRWGEALGCTTSMAPWLEVYNARDYGRCFCNAQVLLVSNNINTLPGLSRLISRTQGASCCYSGMGSQDQVRLFLAFICSVPLTKGPGWQQPTSRCVSPDTS